jgi:hypothetical protein
MRSLTKRSVTRPRPVLMLETLEDRRVMSVGGLFSALQPFAIVQTSHSPISSVLTSTLSSVNTTVHDLDEIVLAGPVKTRTGEVFAQAPGLGVHLNLNIDALFLHAENLRLDLGLSPIGSDQPLPSGVGGKIGVGSLGNGLLNLAPEVNIGLGGSSVASVDAETPVGAPSGPVLDVHTGAGNPGGLTTSVHVGDVPGVLGGAVGGATIGLPASANGSGAALVIPVGNLGNTNIALSNTPAALPTAIFGAQFSAPLFTAPNTIGVDGGGGGLVGDAAFAVLPVTTVSVVDGAATGAVAAPIDLGGGTDVETVLVNPELEGSGLTTRFQPYGLEGAAQDVRSLLNPVGPQSGWLAAWWARFSHAAPWMAGLIVAGAAFEIRRRRRRRTA